MPIRAPDCNAEAPEQNALVASGRETQLHTLIIRTIPSVALSHTGVLNIASKMFANLQVFKPAAKT